MLIQSSITKSRSLVRSPQSAGANEMVPALRGLDLALRQLRNRDWHFGRDCMPESPLTIDLAGRSGERDVSYRSPRCCSSGLIYVEVVAFKVESGTCTANLK